MKASKKSNGIPDSGSRIYALSYALSSMKAHPFRAISLALTLGLGISLLASNIVWADTGVMISTNEYFAENTFQMVVDTYAGQYEEGTLARDYLRNYPIVEKVYSMNSTIGILWGNELDEDTLYDIDFPLYSQGVKDCRVIFVNNEFLADVSGEFNYTGSFELQPGEILVSTQFLSYVVDVFNITLKIGDTIDMEVFLQRVPDWVTIQDDGREIRLFRMETLDDYRIAGIYHPKTYTSLVERAFPPKMRAIWNWTNVRYPVLGMRDSVMVLEDSIPPNSLSPNGWFQTVYLVRASATALVAAGPADIVENFETLISRVEEQFEVDVHGEDHIYYLQWLVDSYLNSLSYSLLNLPIYFLALILSVFAADAFMAPRRTEVGVLRSKGANFNQVYGVFLWEAIFLAVFALVLGMFLSAIFAALIPATTGFMSFDWGVYEYYLLNSVIKPDTLLIAVLLCILPPMLFILYLAKQASTAEIGTTIQNTADLVNEAGESYRFTFGASSLLLAIVVASVIFLPLSPFMLLLNVGLGTSAWFFIAYNGSRVSRIGLARVSSGMSFILGQKNRIAAGYLRMRKGRIVPLMVVLALTMSSTIAFSVQAESLRIDLNREVSYALGTDLRIELLPQTFEYADILESYDGVENVTPVFRCRGTVGNDKITVTALDQLQYAEMGYFDDTSFYSQNASSVLSDLAEVPNGIVLSEFHANRWNKQVGDALNLVVAIPGIMIELIFNVTGLVYTAPGFGYASITDIPYSPLGAGFGFQSGYEGFALTNFEFLTGELGAETTDLFFASLEEGVDPQSIVEALEEVEGTIAHTPETFDLKSYSYGTALFLSTIEGLFSIGFVMALIMSIFALSIFLGSVVRERRREYAVLRALGGSRKQIVSMVFSEFTGIVFASLAVSIILGTIFGYVNGYLLFAMSPFSRLLEASIAFPLEFISIVLAIELVVMIIGAYLPAREAGNTDPAIMLRNL
ncbi:MAG: FtsX-like permease family protein [Candidatus Hodarchaeota archaeon]